MNLSHLFRYLFLVAGVLSLPLRGLGALEKNLSWTESLQKTKNQNEELQSSERSLRASELSLRSSSSGYFPQLSAGVGASQGTSGDEYTLSLNASQNLFAGFLDEGKVSQARANYDIAKANAQTVRAKVSYDLKYALANLVYAQKYIQLSQSILQRRELNLRMVQLRFDGGRENKGSLLLSRAYLEEARLDVLQSQQGLELAKEQLAKVFGESVSENYIFGDPLPLTPPPAEKDVDFQKVILQTPVFRIAIAQEELAQAGVTVAKSGFYPTLNLTASTSQVGNRWVPDQDRWSLGASLVFPLFNGGRDYFGTRSALESLKASTLNKNNTQKDLLVKLRGAYVAFLQAVQRFAVDQSYVLAAEAREKISRQKYNNGLSSFDDWDVIESDLIKRQKNALQSERDRVAAEAAWEQIQGGGVFQ